MADIENVIRALECCNPFNRKCKECPYEKDCYHDGISRHMVADAIELLKEQQEQIDHLIEENASNAEMAEDLNELLKEQDAVVHCKDCVNYNIRPEYKNKKDARGRCDNISFLVGPYWFCAAGKRKEGGDGDD